MMADQNVNKEIWCIIFLCLLWYSTSSVNNVIGKKLLSQFPFPMTVTIVQLFSISAYSGPVLKCMGVKPRKDADISWPYFKKLIIPLGLGKFVATIFSHVSLWKVPISYGHTVKATMPLFTVILSRILVGEKQSLKVYLSLIPIIIGVGIATITEISFNVIGLLAALTSTCSFSMLHIYSKKVLNDTGIHHLRLLHLLGKLAFFMFIPLWIIYDVYPFIFGNAVKFSIEIYILLFLDGFLNWVQNLIAFSLLSRVSPLSYSVANASKRISIITASLFVIGNPVTLPNVFGMFFAIFGVLGYNKTKYDDNMARKKAALIPLSQVTSSAKLNGINIHAHLNGGSSNDGFLNGSAHHYSRLMPNPLQMAPFHPSFNSSSSNPNYSNSYSHQNVSVPNNKEQLGRSNIYQL